MTIYMLNKYCVYILFSEQKFFLNVEYRINQVRLWECKDKSKWAIFHNEQHTYDPQYLTYVVSRNSPFHLMERTIYKFMRETSPIYIAKHRFCFNTCLFDLYAPKLIIIIGTVPTT